MSFDLLIPGLENKSKNTKDHVINILYQEWPLTLKEIYYKIKKTYGYSNTYQAVYKSVKELVGKQVLIESNKKYKINISWIKDLQSFTDIVETNYYTKERLNLVKGLKDSKSSSGITVLNFETIFDAEKYLYYLIKTELFKTKNNQLCFQINHLWKPIFYLRAEYNLYKKLQKRAHKIYYLVSGDSILDQENKEFYEKIGVNVKTTKNSYLNEIIAFNDFFIEIFIPEKLKTKLYGLFEKKENLKILNEVLSKKSSIKIIINRDKELSNETKKKIIKSF
jgi:hypothetical protein